MKFKVLYLPQKQGTKYIRISNSQYNFKKLQQLSYKQYFKNSFYLYLVKHKVEIK